MILGGIAASTSFTLAEIEGMTETDVRFWWNALAAYQQRVREAT
ncbi:hypothetical protein [Azorhizobium caulinodans]